MADKGRSAVAGLKEAGAANASGRQEGELAREATYSPSPDHRDPDHSDPDHSDRDHRDHHRKHRSIAERLASVLPPPQRKRLNLVLSERHIERLERLQHLTDASSVAEVIREAVFVYEKLVEKLMTGSSLKELTVDGDLFPLELGIDVHRPQLEVHETGPDGATLRSFRRRRAASW